MERCPGELFSTIADVHVVSLKGKILGASVLFKFVSSVRSKGDVLNNKEVSSIHLFPRARKSGNEKKGFPLS